MAIPVNRADASSSTSEAPKRWFSPTAAVEIDPAVAQALSQHCPCCGGRMFVIEAFDAGCQPRSD